MNTRVISRLCFGMAFVLLAMPEALFAQQVYRYVGEDGTVTYTDRPQRADETPVEIGAPSVSSPEASYAQGYGPQSPSSTFSQAQLDQMLAPIALYPDSLLSQILMAATYPLEIVKAARWSRANPGLQGDQAVKSVEQFDWDPSVKSLTAFPQILSMMDERLDWTQSLGDAFLAQQGQVMDTVQGLRRKAYEAGNLRTTEQIQVAPVGPDLDIGFANPEAVYVPYYDPMVVYGGWWWPAYPPVYWAPWPRYRPGYVRGFYWGPAIAVSAGFFFGAANWRRHEVNVVHNQYYGTVLARREPDVRMAGGQTVWQHDPAHRQAVPYRSAIGRESSAPESRAQFRGYQPPPTAIGAAVSRPAQRPMTTLAPAAPAPAARIVAPPVPPRVTEQRPSMFETVNQGGRAHDMSARGRASYERAAPRVAPPTSAPAMRAPASTPAPRAAPSAAPPAPAGRGSRH